MAMFAFRFLFPDFGITAPNSYMRFCFQGKMDAVFRLASHILYNLLNDNSITPSPVLRFDIRTPHQHHMPLTPPAFPAQPLSHSPSSSSLGTSGFKARQTSSFSPLNRSNHTTPRDYSCAVRPIMGLLHSCSPVWQACSTAMCEICGYEYYD